VIDRLERTAALLLPWFVLVEVNHPQLQPLSRLALFALGGSVVLFLGAARGGSAGIEERTDRGRRAWLAGLAATACVVFGYVTLQTEPLFAGAWSDRSSLGDRAGAETGLDVAIGVLGLLVVLEMARRALGWALPALSVAFLAYGWLGPWLPPWLLPHRGYGLERLVSQTFLHSQGVFGIALQVMFTYVFLFVVFGALLEATGATRFVVDLARRLFRGSAGGSAKVAVLSSGLLGSLSGSAVANTATTGTFTIPMMRSSGFPPRIAAGIEAAASSGGALVPPVMGAGAYMMLEIVQPPVTYLEILRAALVPAMLYYLSLLLLVHGISRRMGAATIDEASDPAEGTARSWRYEGVVFGGGLGALLLLLLLGFSVVRAVSGALVAVWALALLHPRTRLGPARLGAALRKGCRTATPLVAAGACVGIVIGVVTLTGAGTRLPALVVPLAQDHLLPALVLLMVCSLVLGMGLPSAVCYLLLATFVGPALGDLGVAPLAGHLFIFYFGMMSMVTPPVALAAYAASSIAGSPLLATANAAFRFALVGFTLPFLFVFRPQLLMLDAAGGAAPLGQVGIAVALAALGIWPLASGLSGFLLRPIGWRWRCASFAAAALALFPGSDETFGGIPVSWANLLGVALFGVMLAAQWRLVRMEGRRRREGSL
jgi:TRAP transporter 4TM/12TM fusion protein